MGIFKNETTTVVKKGYVERLEDVKSIFKTAHDKAAVIMDDMQKEIETKKAQVDTLNEKIKEISLIQADASNFMSNLKNFI